jgi:molybdopterin-guanine dinucleotide biosynthesis protein A
MNPPTAKIASTVGAVLAGGASRRLGSDKALVEVEGRTLIERASEVLDVVFTETLVIAPARAAYAALDVVVTPDLRPALGPLGGLHTALVRAAGRSVFLLACDMPRVTTDVVRWLIDGDSTAEARRSASEPWVRVPRDAAGLQPLCGLYSGACLAPVEDALEAGRRSARGLLDRLRAEILEVDPDASWYRPDLFASVNTPTDVQRLVETGSCVS